MLGALFTSKTRLKLLIKFFVSSSNTGYLRGIAEEFDESTNSIRKELNQLTEAGFLDRREGSKKVIYQANDAHPLFLPVQKLIHSFLGIDQIIDQVMDRSGSVEQVILVGEYAKGVESDTLRVVILGETLNQKYLLQLAEKMSVLISKKVEVTFEKPEKGNTIVIYHKSKEAEAS